jgi:hypothetical protein
LAASHRPPIEVSIGSIFKVGSHRFAEAIAAGGLATNWSSAISPVLGQSEYPTITQGPGVTDHIPNDYRTRSRARRCALDTGRRKIRECGAELYETRCRLKWGRVAIARPGRMLGSWPSRWPGRRDLRDGIEAQSCRGRRPEALWPIGHLSGPLVNGSLLNCGPGAAFRWMFGYFFV